MDKKDKKILVIEDDEALAGMYAEGIKKEGYTVILATDGQKGAEIILAETPDFIVLDIMLPKKNGFEILEIIRSTPHTRHIPIIVLTAFSKSEYAEKVNSYGVAGFFNKAITVPKEIVFLINNILFSAEKSDSIQFQE